MFSQPYKCNPKFFELNWWRLGYVNYNYFLSRNYFCYSGKRIYFQHNLTQFFNVCYQFEGVLNER